jgi:hypothetical protein
LNGQPAFKAVVDPGVSRRFSLHHQGRAIDVLVEPVDEAWELWLCEHGRRLTLAGTVPIDDAVAAWREGKDPVLLMVEHIRARVASGELDLDVQT